MSSDYLAVGCSVVSNRTEAPRTMHNRSAVASSASECSIESIDSSHRGTPSLMPVQPHSGPRFLCCPPGLLTITAGHAHLFGVKLGALGTTALYCRLGCGLSGPSPGDFELCGERGGFSEAML